MTGIQLREAYLSAKRALFDQYYDKLNDRQREAVYRVNGPLLILAGAGSGKTTVLVNRIAHIIRYGDAYRSDAVPEEITEADVEALREAGSLSHEELGEYLTRFAVNPPEPWQVMAITFTNKAAREIKSRIASVFGEDS